MSDAVRTVDLERIAPFTFTRDTGDGTPAGDGNTLDGYASVFGVETIIDSWEGRFKEQFLSGSMKRSFRELTPLIQFEHGRHPLIGSLPIARFDSGYPREETDAELAPNGGAHVVAKLHTSPIFEPVREVISTGTVNGMSIRFGVDDERWYWPDGRQEKSMAAVEAELFRTWMEDVPDEELLRRDIVRAGVSEMGPVVWPAYTTTSVGVRSLLGGMTDGLDTDARKAILRQVAADMRQNQPTRPLAAPDDERNGGEKTDAERQAVEASRKARRLIRARVMALRGL